MTAFMKHLGTFHSMLASDMGVDTPFDLDAFMATPMEEKSWIHHLVDRNKLLKKRFVTVSDWPHFSTVP